MSEDKATRNAIIVAGNYKRDPRNSTIVLFAKLEILDNGGEDVFETVVSVIGPEHRYPRVASVMDLPEWRTPLDQVQVFAF